MNRELELEHRLTKVEEACAVLPEMAKQMDEMSKQLTKYDTRWGTIFMVGTALWAVFVTFKDSFWNWIRGH